MSRNQKHQVNELLKESMRLTENLAIHKDKYRLATNSLLWEVPGILFFLLILCFTFLTLSQFSASAALKPYIGAELNLGKSHVQPMFGPFSIKQIAIALMYPPLYTVMNALAIFEGNLTPTGANFMVQSLQFISTQAAATNQQSGGTLTALGYAGTLESIVPLSSSKNAFIAVATQLYNVFVESGIEGGKSLDNANNVQLAWDYWMGVSTPTTAPIPSANQTENQSPNNTPNTQYAWLAPNLACLLSNPLLRCGDTFTIAEVTAQPPPTKETVIKAAASNIQQSLVWQAVLGHGLCGVAILTEGSDPQTMFANVFGGVTQHNGQPDPCDGVSEQQMYQFGAAGMGVGGALSFLLAHPASSAAEASDGSAAIMFHALAAIVSIGVTAGGAVGGAYYGNSVASGMGCGKKS